MIISISSIYASDVEDSNSINCIDDSVLIDDIGDSNEPINSNSDYDEITQSNSNSNELLGAVDDYDVLYSQINNTPKGGILELGKDYKFANNSNFPKKGILISKSITIDGKGHSINANKVSRVFNVTANNVVLRNINFINGNALGRYDNIDAGGGAIYWYGHYGKIENCTFFNNTGWGIEDDPFDDGEEIIIDENGNEIHRIIMRPIGARTNEGGAIVWKGKNGTVSNCIFHENDVGYPNAGGAISWKGDNGQIINSTFYKNWGWCGGAVCWTGNNGKIISSVFFNNSMFDGDIYWFGKKGLIKKSILLKSDGGRAVVRVADGSLTANYNFWGDTFNNPNGTIKLRKLSNWYILNSNFTHPKLFKGEKLLVDFDDFLLVTKYGNVYKNGEKIAKINLNPKAKIISKSMKKYYNSSKKFKVKVFGPYGKLAINKIVKFRLNKKTYKVKTNKKGFASLKVNLKPGNYTVIIKYSNAKVKNNVTVKSTLITKDLTKKVGKRKYFPIKVLSTKGKPYAKQLVKVKFRGKAYRLKTRKNGIASFIASKRLSVGKYKIKVSYKGLTNTNKIIVKRK